MAVEAARGCGYRQVGGLYMVSGKLSEPCGRLPLELHVCPTCKQGIKQARAWTWVKPRALFEFARSCTQAEYCEACPLYKLPERAGLLWIGAQFYKTADAFMDEAARLGVSRRIPKVPKDFVLGETWVLMAHPAAITRGPRNQEEEAEAIAAQMKVAEASGENLDLRSSALIITRPGIVTMFRPTAIEKIFVESDRDTDRVAEAIDKGITPVFVPDDDPDHNPKANKRGPNGQLALDDPTTDVRFQEEPGWVESGPGDEL